MNREQIIKQFGESWVDFMTPFATTKAMDDILGAIKADKETGKVIHPEPVNVFRAFRETALEDVRVVLLGMDPYPNHYATGIAFGCDQPRENGLPPSLEKIIDAVELDAYNGLNFDKPTFDITLQSWAKQGVLMLNTALTVPFKEIGAHTEIWKPFISFFIENIQMAKKNLIFCGWGGPAQEALKGVNIFFEYMPATCSHPSAAARAKIPWECRHFTQVNTIIRANRLGDLIKW